MDTRPPRAYEQVRVLLVDDHAVFRLGLNTVIDGDPAIEVCGEAPGAAQAVQLFAELQPDAVLVDLSLGEGCGMDLIQQLKAMDEDVRILVISMQDDMLFAERALHAGALGYINKRESPAEILSAIHTVVAGQIYVSDEIAQRILKSALHLEQAAASPFDALTNRELEVYRGIGEGLSTRDIATRLHLSVKTVETHRANIKKKLALADNNELVRHAMRWAEDDTPPALQPN